MIGEGNEILGSLNLKLDPNDTLQKLESAGKKNIADELSGKFNFESGIIEFNQEIINDKNREFIEEIKNAKLWKERNFQFLSSFKDAPGLKYELEVGSETGDVILVPKIIINKEVIRYVQERNLKNSPKKPSAEAACEKNGKSL